MTDLTEKLKVQQWPIGRLIAYPSNPRKNDAAVDRMVEAIREFGFRIPVVAKSTGEVVDGHLRLKAALALGMTKIPVALADGLSDAQIKAFRLLANRSATWAEWDMELLHTELDALKMEDFDLALTGFDEAELADIFADRTAGLTDPDDTPEPPANPVSRAGDLWIMGEHRLMCGDATKAEDVARALGATKPHLMVTDPPYGVNYSAGWRNEAMPAKNDPTRLKDGSGRAIGAVTNDNRADWREAWVLFGGDVAYVWHGALHTSVVLDGLAESGLAGRALLIWVKQQFVIGRGDYHSQHEPCWYAVRKGSRGHWQGDRTQSTVWQIDKPVKSETGHSTQKPVECMRRPIENNSRAGDAVYDPFVGSFTTGIACEMMGRRLIALEISPAYVDVGIRRWQNFCGGAATLEETGETFAQVEIRRASERAPAEAATAA